MITAVVDTNVIVAGVLTTSSRSASRQLIDRLGAGDFLLALSPPTLAEVLEVLQHPRLRAIHGLTAREVRQFVHSLEQRSRMFSGELEVSAALTRDVTDTKWIALSIEASADFLVTNDRRHLQRLKRIGRTEIVSAGRFLRALSLD